MGKDGGGWNENYYGSYNTPETAAHMTPEFLADEFFTLVLNESKQFKDSPENLADAGHFNNDIDYDMEFFYGTVTLGEISPESYNRKKYRVSMTDVFHKRLSK